MSTPMISRMLNRIFLLPLTKLWVNRSSDKSALSKRFQMPRINTACGKVVELVEFTRISQSWSRTESHDLGKGPIRADSTKYTAVELWKSVEKPVESRGTAVERPWKGRGKAVELVETPIPQRF